MSKNGKFFRVVGEIIIIALLLGTIKGLLNYTNNNTVKVSKQSIQTVADKTFANPGTNSSVGYDKKSTMMDEDLGSNGFSGSAVIIENGRVMFQKAYANADYYFKIPNRINTVYSSDVLTMAVNMVLMDQLINESGLNGKEKLDAFNVSNKLSNVSLATFLSQSKNVIENTKFNTNGRSELFAIHQYNDTSRKIIESISSKKYQDLVQSRVIQKLGLSDFGLHINYADSLYLAKNYKTKKSRIQYTNKVKSNANTIVTSPLSAALFMNSIVKNKLQLTATQQQEIKNALSDPKGGIYLHNNTNHQYFQAELSSDGKSGYVIVGNYSPTKSFDKKLTKLLGQVTVKGK